jgi:AcrR family transcriptional regulator
MSTVEAQVSRRERVRASTVEEIKTVALRLLTEQGPEAATLRAIAREMGMTAPGLYRYFPSHEHLHRALVADCYDRLSVVLSQARDGAATLYSTDVLATGKPLVAVELMAAARAFRDWAVANPREFALVFGAPVPSMTDVGTGVDDDPVHAAGMRFGGVFTEIFLRLWTACPFEVAPDQAMPPALGVQLSAYRDRLVALFGEQAATVPLGALETFLHAWVQLYGLVAMEVFRHLHFCLDDVGPFFDRSLVELGRTLGWSEPANDLGQHRADPR